MELSCAICGNRKSLVLLTDEFSEQNSMRTVSDAFQKCFNLQFLDKHSKEDVRICKKCIARLKFCCSFRKDVERAHRHLYEQYLNEKEKEYEGDIEGYHNRQYTNYEYKNYKPDNTDYNESFNNDDYEINNHYGNQSGCLSDIDDSPYSSDWSQDTDDILTHTGYSREIKVANIKVKDETPGLDKNITTCPICGKRVPFHVSLLRHYKSHFPLYLCHICGLSYTEHVSLKNHMPIHYGTKFECTTCSKTFKTKNVLTGHIKTVHLGIDRLLCPRCGLRFKNMKTRTRHLVRVHNMENMKYRCLYCKFRYTVDSEYLAHVKKEHFDLYDKKCVECGLVFKSPYDLREHNAKHIDNAEFKCKFCDKEFKSRRNYKNHYKSHLETKDYTCHYCRKSFSWRRNFINHLKTHETYQPLLTNTNQHLQPFAS